ncbi:short chain dehydrogenase/ reductase [Emericellopsis atlantica]|uniref:Short chain dehydrogenase/ reductase n=1 Tax=Emericellopsis atlantica TaxID=2614577 RepID=A0A9P7ZI29_9HYPO|nr:short chain dehydrogenase/ reductase [Emericellopsis atlantica]KAG9252533.1 short chain dehydrogenase/ reductase [Emericellopsis atlantica]
MSLAGKVFTVTGGASGIGLATARKIVERGGTVCIGDVDTSALEKAEVEFSSKSSPYSVTRIDVSQRAEVDNWIADCVAKFGRLDGAANIAGVTGKDHGQKVVRDQDDGEWHKIIGVNLTGVMHCLRAQLRVIEDKGSIVNMASIHGHRGMANYAAYSASKHGVIGLTEAAAQENGQREVRVNAVAPGPIYTPMMQKHWDMTGRPAGAPFDDPIAFPRQGTAEEVANVVLFLLGPESSFVSGSCYDVDGAWT